MTQRKNQVARRGLVAKGPASRPRRPRRPSATLLLGAAVVAALGLLAAAGAAYVYDRDLAAVAQVAGQTINRAEVRDREAVLSFVARDQQALIEKLRLAGRIDQDEASALTAALGDAADPRAAAIADLTDAVLVRAAARERGITVADVDPGTELVRERVSQTDRRVSWLRLAWQPSARSSTVPDELELRRLGVEVRTALDAGGDRAAMLASYAAEGWSVSSGTKWLAAEGPVDGLDPELVAVARSAPVGHLEPVTGTGWVSVADVSDIEPLPSDAAGGSLREDARAASVPDGALSSWASDRALSRKLATSLLEGWQTTPALNVRAAELVIGPADPEGPSGPWVELAHLVVADIPVSSVPPGSGSPAEQVAASLGSLDPAARRDRFRSLVEAARDGSGRSGELGWFVREQLAPSLARAAYADGVSSGSVLGPITTEAGPELFLVESRYAGPLDDRATGVLSEVITGRASLEAMASRTIPGEAALATAGVWVAEAELAQGSDAHRALVETPIGELSEPFIMDGHLVIARILERRTDTPDAAARARLGVTGYAAWLAGQRASAPITQAPGEPGAPSAEPTGSSVPTPLPQETPRLPITPVVPGPS